MSDQGGGSFVGLTTGRIDSLRAARDAVAAMGGGVPATSVPSRTPDGDRDAEFGFGPSAPKAPTASKDGRPLSDNARLERMAGGGMSAATVLWALFAALGLIIAIGAAILAVVVDVLGL